MEGRATRLRERFERAGQGHVFRFWPELASASRARLLEQLEEVDLELVAELGRLARGAKTAGPVRFEPPEVLASSDARVLGAADVGNALLAAGKVGFVVVAGGQASRLGYEGPKGAFPVAPVSRRTLFELFARRLLAVEARHRVAATWYVLTSDATDAPTRAFFEERDYFGLKRENVFFLRQAMLPALDEHGKIALSAKDALFLAPNGHGGVLAALRTSGALDHARERGIEVLSYFQVDNPLAPPADARFLGLHAVERAQMSSKVVAKRSADEKVGVLGRVDGKLACIEYSDLPVELREARDAAGKLVFGAGNIAMHAIDRTFVERLTEHGLALPWHVARKELRALDDTGAERAIQGFKFESFVFDALAFVERAATLEVAREREFSPVKNKQGDDSPATAHRDQCMLHAGWAERAGFALPPRDEHGVPPVEVDPLLAEDEATFRARARAPRVTALGHVYE